jgi:predicted 2-oxoglutarate/Fe(II)-dependent dioxygenase YbiX
MNELNNSNTPLSDFIEIYKEVIPKHTCDDIIVETESHSWLKHTWYDLTKNSFESEENNELDVLEATEDVYKKLYIFIEESVKDYNKKYSYSSKKTTTIVNKLSSIRLNRYSVNQMMHQHHDHIHALFDGKEKGIPVLSIVCNLNDNYTGGELYFWKNYFTDLNQGDIVIFPSNFMYPHGVKKITDGVRYSAVAWAW